MGFVPIKINGKEVYIHSAISNPDFGGDSVLAADPWDYVALQLRRTKNLEAFFYWEQARQFYKASTELSEVASPLTSYYCFLNATKALLSQKNIGFHSYHGVSGKNTCGMNLSNEIVKINRHGVLPSLCKFLEEDTQNEENYSLEDILYNLPFLHRAFTLTYKSKPELFLPIKNARFVRKEGSSEAWFVAEVEKRYECSQIEKILPSTYEVDTGVTNCCLIRRKKRFEWIPDEKEIDKNLSKLNEYNKKIRKDVIPIFAPVNSWYIKKQLESVNQIEKSQLPLVFAAMHRLSELSRYDPIRLVQHLEAEHNWIVTEFLRIAPAQFINHIACEITGKEFIKPHAVRLP